MLDPSVALKNRQYPWLKFLPTCHSTNTWAKEQRSQLVHGDVVFTPRQTAGRGQHGRTWISPAGVLTASLILDGMPPQVNGLSLVAGLAVIEAVEFLLPELHQQLQLKWVNDIWLNRRKLAGILCEGAGDRVIVGVGLNRCVTFDDPTAIGYPVSLHEFVAAVPDELILLEQIRHTLLKFSDRLIRQGLQDFLDALNFRDGLTFHQIEAHTEHGIITGEAMGIDAQGRLRLQTADGYLQTLVNARIVKWHKTT